MSTAKRNPAAVYLGRKRWAGVSKQERKRVGRALLEARARARKRRRPRKRAA